jgi:hypothetical protein
MSKSDQYVGLDASLNETSICVIDDAGRIVWRGKTLDTEVYCNGSEAACAPSRSRANLPSSCIACGRPAQHPSGRAVTVSGCMKFDPHIASLHLAADRCPTAGNGPRRPRDPFCVTL